MHDMNESRHESWLTKVGHTKVPLVGVVFWVTKLLTTAMGESTSDSMVHGWGPPTAVVLGTTLFALAMALQLRAKTYVATIYWFAVVMVSVFGTIAADVMHVGLGIPYAISTTFWGVALAVIFLAWYRCEGTLSIHSIVTTRRELFYWSAVLAAFALGTAVGDLTAVTLHLGYLASGLAFGVLFAIPGLLYWRWKFNGVAMFWAAYILTRPFGASFADYVGVSKARGGLGLGTVTMATVLSIGIVICVAYLQVSKVDVAPQISEGDAAYKS